MMRALMMILAITCTSCSFAWNATHGHTWHPTRASMQADANELRAQGHRRMAARLEREWDAKVTSPMFCMFGDMGLMMGGFGALAAAQALERRGMSREWVEPINIAGLAVSAIVFVSLGVTLKLYDHL